MNWKFWQQPKPVIRVNFVERDNFTLRLHEFCSDEKLTNGAAQALQGYYLKTMVGVLKVEHPAYGVLVSPTLEERAAYQARCEGYTLCLANLEAMGRYQKPAEEIHPTFEPEEIYANRND